MGILRVGLSHTVTIPSDTVPIPGMDDNQPIIYVVCDETCGMSDIRGHITQGPHQKNTYINFKIHVKL